MFRLGHRDTKNENNLGHRDTENADKMLGHRDTKNADRLGHRDIKNVEKIGFGFLRLENQVYWFLFSTNFPNFVPIFHSFFCCIIFSKEHIFILCIVKSPIEACFLFFLENGLVAASNREQLIFRKACLDYLMLMRLLLEFSIHYNDFEIYKF